MKSKETRIMNILLDLIHHEMAIRNAYEMLIKINNEEERENGKKRNL